VRTGTPEITGTDRAHSAPYIELVRRLSQCGRAAKFLKALPSPLPGRGVEYTESPVGI
jgi:hypothetical protein